MSPQFNPIEKFVEMPPKPPQVTNNMNRMQSYNQNAGHSHNQSINSSFSIIKRNDDISLLHYDTASDFKYSVNPYENDTLMIKQNQVVQQQEFLDKKL